MCFMWWIRSRAKVIIPVLLVAVAVVVAAFVLPGGGTSSVVAKPGDETAGVRVFTDKDGKIVVTGRDPAEIALSLALPQNCAQIVVFMDDVAALYPKSAGATDEVRVHVTIMQRLAQDLCSYREYSELSKSQFSSWYVDWQTPPDASAPATSAPATSAPDGAAPADTSVVDPASSTTAPADATITTVTGG